MAVLVGAMSALPAPAGDPRPTMGGRGTAVAGAAYHGEGERNIIVELGWSHDGKDCQRFTAPAGVEPVTVRAAGGGLHFTGAVVGLHARRTGKH